MRIEKDLIEDLIQQAEQIGAVEANIKADYNNGWDLVIGVRKKTQQEGQ